MIHSILSFGQKVLLVTAILGLAGCSTPINNKDIVKSLPGTVPVANDTPYSDQLRLLGKQIHPSRKYVIAIGPIEDRTGQFSSGQGYQMTQGADYMAVAAVAKTGLFDQVDRINMNIINNEIDYSEKFLLSDSNDKENFKKGDGKVRVINYGTIKGSDYILTGALTELNYLADSSANEIEIAGVGGGWRNFWADVGIDLMLVNTKTTQIVKTVSLRKQIYGYENKLGLFRLFGSTLVNAYSNTKRQEPVQFAVRMAIEAAVFEMAQYLYHVEDKHIVEPMVSKSKLSSKVPTLNPLISKEHDSKEILLKENPNQMAVQIMLSHDQKKLLSMIEHDQHREHLLCIPVKIGGKELYELVAIGYPTYKDAVEARNVFSADFKIPVSNMLIRKIRDLQKYII